MSLEILSILYQLLHRSFTEKKMRSQGEKKKTRLINELKYQALILNLSVNFHHIRQKKNEKYYACRTKISAKYKNEKYKPVSSLGRLVPEVEEDTPEGNGFSLILRR